MLYAVWERENTGGSDEPPAPKKVVIIFDGNGADIQDGNRVEIDYGSKLSFSLVPYLERDGYILKGWSYDPEGHYLLKPSRDTFTEDETVLYAVWERENTGDTTDSSDTSDTLPVHKHSYGGWVVVESPTCTETGLREKSCDCGDTVTEVIDATGHQYTDKVSKPTCIVQGYTTHECECGHSYVGEYVDATGHTEEMVEGRAPTCEEAGVTDGKKCSTCGEYTVPQEEISAKGHNYVKGVCSECQKEYSSVGLRYTLSEDGTYYTVSGGDCIDMDIFISSTYEGKPVKGIDSYAFYLHPEFRSVTMPNSITTIGAYAFHGCDELESINLSVELTEIGDFAFYGCDMLASIDIPSSVLSIGRSAFWGCDSLTSVAIHNGKIGVQAFASCAALKSASIGRGVTDIGQQAFYNCGKLETVTIPSNVSSVGLCAFEKCKNVTVYCEASKRPSGWHSQWNATFNIYDITNVTFCSVVWGADLDSMTNCS